MPWARKLLISCGSRLVLLGTLKQRLQPGRQQGFGSPDQFRGAVDRRQGIVRQLFQALMQQHLGLQQQLDLVQVQRQQVSLELAHQVVKRCRQFGDRPHARHIGTALEGVQRPLQFVAGGQRQMFGGLFEKMVEAVQVRSPLRCGKYPATAGRWPRRRFLLPRSPLRPRPNPPTHGRGAGQTGRHRRADAGPVRQTL